MGRLSILEHFSASKQSSKLRSLSLVIVSSLGTIITFRAIALEKAECMRCYDCSRSLTVRRTSFVSAGSATICHLQEGSVPLNGNCADGRVSR